MIRSFTDKSTQAIYEGKWVKKFQSFYEQAERRLQILDSAIALDDLKKLPSNRFEALKGDRIGINKQWRICFRWKDNKAHDVEIVDYH
jgi:proteic killer suppression protein